MYRRLRILFNVIILFILAVIYSAQTALPVYAIDICANHGYYQHCERPGDPNDRWVISPHESVGGNILKIITAGGAGDVCAYDHNGGYECYQGQTCAEDPPGPNDQTPRNPRCVGAVAPGVQTRPATCTCDKPPGQSGGGGNNGFHCQKPDGTPGDQQFCNDARTACMPDPQSTNANTPGVLCNSGHAGRQYPTLVPPPPPPCVQFDAQGKCQEVSTALGNLKTDPSGFITTVFGILLSVSGGIALLLIIRAGYWLMTSGGQPEKINNARDQLIAAIVGLIFLIFSLVMLQVIGVEILKAPCFFSNGAGCNDNAAGGGAAPAAGAGVPGTKGVGGAGLPAAPAGGVNAPAIPAGGGAALPVPNFQAP
jgi:hypothetical protein